MRAKAPVKKKGGKRSPNVRTACAKGSQPFSLRRRSLSEFSCGVDLERALLVEESLDERERRG
jgi:hypothetical protein